MSDGKMLLVKKDDEWNDIVIVDGLTSEGGVTGVMVIAVVA